jgi:hypothetical protein
MRAAYEVLATPVFAVLSRQPWQASYAVSYR